MEPRMAVGAEGRITDLKGNSYQDRPERKSRNWGGSESQSRDPIGTLGGNHLTPAILFPRPWPANMILKEESRRISGG